MPVRLPTVRALCTEPELALVVASRKPELKLLKPAQVERLRERARKLVDKWKDLSREQVRKQSRKVGAVVEDTRSHQKAEIFAEALAAFDARLAELQGGSKAKPKPKPAAKKPARTADHRATRADVRSSLKEKKLALNAPAKKAKAAPPVAGRFKKPCRPLSKPRRPKPPRPPARRWRRRVREGAPPGPASQGPRRRVRKRTPPSSWPRSPPPSSRALPAQALRPA